MYTYIHISLSLYIYIYIYIYTDYSSLNYMGTCQRRLDLFLQWLREVARKRHYEYLKAAAPVLCGLFLNSGETLV